MKCKCVRGEEYKIKDRKLICELNRLNELARKGIKPFSEANEENKNNFIFWDEFCCLDGKYYIVLDSFIDVNHHDVISHYGKYFAFVTFPKEPNGYYDYEKPYIIVEILDPFENEIIIENGIWHFK